jgi:transposase
MSKKPIAMDHLKQVIQLAKDKVPIKEIVRRTGISRNSVRKYLHKLRNKPLSSLSDKELADIAYDNELLEQNTLRLQTVIHFCKYAASELSRTGVDRQLLWRDYLDKHPDGYCYSQFCYHLQGYLKNSDLSMHMEYNPGDIIMVDFAGKKMHYVEEATGECIPAEIFLAILPYCGLIFCYAVNSQKTEDLILCFNAMLRFFGGTPATILCDNLKTAVSRASRYEPVFTEMCNQLGEHYNTTFSATRPYSPRDKAMVEKAVSITYKNIYATLRNRTFTSLKSLNIAIEEQLASWHRYPSEWNPEKFISEALLIDESVAAYIKKVLARNEYPEKNYRACQGILNYKNRVGDTRLINACKRADSFSIYNYGIIERILKSKADFIPLEDEKNTQSKSIMPQHENIRGGEYYQ